MPNPISRVMPNANIIIGNAGHRALSERKELAVLAMEAIGSSSNVENFLLHLFMTLFGGDKAMAARIYLALDVQRAKTQALNEAVSSVANEKIRDLINAVIGLSKTTKKSRDDLAHHIWGISPQLPDALLLLDPKATLTERLNRDEVYVWTAQDFQSLIRANDGICGYGLSVRWILDNHVANRDGRLYDELCSKPEIRERLDRQV